jgi:tetratricopeptide (TPR) repeat protein
VALAAAVAGCSAARFDADSTTVRIFGDKRVPGRYISDKAYYHYVRGDLFSLSGNAEAAAEEFRFALAFDPEAVELHRRLAEELARLGRFDEAVEEVQRALRCDGKDAESLMLLGRLRARTGNLAAGFDAFRRAVQAEPENEMTHLTLADAQLASGDLKATLATLRAMCERLPRSAECQLRLGRVLAPREPAVALAHLRRSLELDPGRPEVMVEAAELLAQTGHSAEAVAVMRDALERAGDKLAVAERLIRLLIDRGDRRAAHDVVDLLDEGSPGDARQAVVLASLYRALKDTPKAMAQADSALKLRPDLHLARLLRGLLLEETKRPGEAVVEYLKVPAAADEFVDARRRAADVLRGQGKLAEAIALCERALADKPEADELVDALVQLLARAGQAPRALATVTAALKRRPDSETLQYALATVYEQAGQWPRAVEEMRRLLTRNPRHAAALNFIGYGLAERGLSLDEAERLVSAALALRPTDGYIQDSLGWVYFKMGRLDDALRILEQANRSAPNEPEILKHLGEVYLRRREPARAVELFRRALDRNPDAKIRRELEDELRRIESPQAKKP